MPRATNCPISTSSSRRPITDSTVLLANLKTGDLQAAYTIAPKDVASVKRGSESCCAPRRG